MAQGEYARGLDNQVDGIYSDGTSGGSRQPKRATEGAELKGLRDSALDILDREREIVAMFMDVSFRKVRARDEYGDEDWHALQREVALVVKKLAEKHAVEAWRRCVRSSLSN